MIFRPPPRVDKPEIIDDPATSDEEYSSTFRDLARINRFLGGRMAVESALKPLLKAAEARKVSSAEPIRILDIGTGSGDIPRYITVAAARGRFGPTAAGKVQITATDANAKVLDLARRLTPVAQYPSITVEEADALALPFADGAFDIALCSLTLHHFSPEDCARILREMNRVTTVGLIINDLIRSRLAASLVALWARITFADRLTRHDGPTSVLRAYVLEEYAEIARAAGLKDVTLRHAPIYRAVLIHRKSG